MKEYSFYHSTPVQIRFNDVDVMGHVNNSVYQNYFDIARVHYFEDVFEYRMDWHDKALVLVHIEIDFYQPVNMYDEVRVLTKVVHMGNKSLRMEQRLVGKSEDDIRCVNQAVLSAFHYDTGEAIPLLSQWRKHIQAFEKDMEFGSAKD